jgi:BclB C-terminal domain-containing protein
MTIYESAAPDNDFTPLTATSLNLPALTGTIAIGDFVSENLTGLSVPVTLGNRYLLVISASSTGLNLFNTVIGYASAGITIS